MEQTSRPMPLMSLKKKAGFKDQNSSMHFLEALTALFQVWPNDLLFMRLSEIFHLMRDNIINDAGEVQLNFYPNWEPFQYKSDKDAINDNFDLSQVIFGHGLETAYLLLDAEEALGNNEYEKTLRKTKIMVDRAILDGFDLNIGGIHSCGYHFKSNSTFSNITIIDPSKDWWTQAEGLYTILRFYYLFLENQNYKNTFILQWKYIQQYIIDSEYGGWIEVGVDVTPSAKKYPKGQIWKVNFHDGRSLINCINLIK